MAEGGELSGGGGGVKVEVVGSVGRVEESLVFLDGSKEKYNGVMHEGQSLAGFPITEE